MNRFFILILFSVLSVVSQAQNNTLLIEAESFANKGGWVVDQQFVEQMGSPYLLAHGLGIHGARRNQPIWNYLSSSIAAKMNGAIPFVSLSIRFSFT